MRILYKVVTNSRHSSVSEGQYCLKYNQGKIVKSLPGSFGIFCFEKLEDAEHYREWILPEGIIIEVMSIGRKRKIPNEIVTPYIQNLDILYYEFGGKLTSKVKKRLDLMRVHKGTVCYPEVRVLT